MAGVIVFIICMVLAVLTYKKVSNRCKMKGRGGFSTLTLSLVMSFMVFFVSIGIGVGVVSENNSTAAKASAAGGAKKTKSNVYKCDKFDAITQTRQGTKNDSGYYSDKGILIEYTVSDDKLIMRMPIPNDKDSIYIGTFNKIAADGSRKYGNSSSNYFVSDLNDSTIKVITVNFDVKMTLTQICSK